MAVAPASSATLDQATTSLTWVLTAPSGIASGDVLVAALNVNGIAQTFTAPTGWVLIASKVTAGNSSFVVAYYLICGGSEPSTYTFTLPTTAQAGSAGIERYTGADGTTPSDVAASTNSGTSAAPRGLSITTVTAGAMVIMMVGLNSAAATIAPASGMTEEWENAGTGKHSELADVIQAAAGASGDKDGSLSISKDWATILWALRPAAGAAGPFPPFPRRFIRLPA